MQIAIKIRPLPSPRPRVGKYGTRMPKPYMDYKKTIEKHCHSFIKLKGAVKVELKFHYKRSKTHNKNKMSMPIGDIDNLCKSVLDALEGVAYENDRQVVQLIATKGNSDEYLVEIRVSTYA